jgi:RNA polymerase sigma factor (sigma-70 family)
MIHLNISSKNSTPTVIDDQKLWRKFRKGEKQAVNKIYRRFYLHMLKYGLRIKHNEEFIKDCIQEVFFDLLKPGTKLGDTDSILSYLFVSLRRKIFRKIRYDQYFRLDDNFNMTALPENNLEDEIFSREDSRIKRDRLKKLIDKLSPRQKEALLMRYYLAVEYQDIAGLMELNVQSVRNLIYQALKTLREQMKNRPS